MNRKLNTSRITVIVVVMAILLSIYASALFDLQIKNGDSYYASSRSAIVTTRVVEAARGRIFDRNGKLLAYSRTVYNIAINRNILMRNDNPNSIILELCSTVRDYGASYTDTFPVTKLGPFSYIANMNDTQREYLNGYFDYFKKDRNTLAADLISWMRDHYLIDLTTGVTDARTIIGVRYEMELRLMFDNMDDYIFVEDADADLIAVIKEKNLPGVEVITTSKREYTTPYAAHILGYIGLQSPEEYAENKEKEGYGYNTKVGKEGIEAVFEEYLHGVDGSITFTTDTKGTVTGILSETPAKSGNDTYSTIDIDLCAAAYTALENTIADINSQRTNTEQAGGGAVVVREVNSGDVLVCESYPSYDLANIKTIYNELAADPNKPLFNRATMGEYNPGSTFKMITAYAGLSEGAISPYTTVECTGRYIKYKGYSPACWVSPSNHGVLNVVGALENSCNIFFYWLGDKIGIEPIAKTAKLFGFGQKTGIEIGESLGKVATKEYKKQVLNDGWWAADNLISAIGQGLNEFTPIQIANYVTAIANGGTLYKNTLLKCIKSAESGETIVENEPEVLSKIDDSEGYLSILRSGMRAVATTGTAASTFSKYPVKVAAKTGTVQSDSSSQNTGVFVCYAPYDNPEIEITVVVEGGGSGSSLSKIALAVLDEYFEDDTMSTTISGEYQLVH